MDITFLDIDGVINDGQYYNFSEAIEINPIRINIINRLFETTKSKVVLSTSWRNEKPLEELRSILKEKGFIGEIIDITPDLQKENYGSCRGKEIQKWIDDNHFTSSFVILDDYEEMFHLKPFLVKINYFYGITDDDVNKAIDILIKQL